MVSFSRLNSFYMLSSKSIQQRFTVKRYLNRIIFDETDQITYNQDDSNILVRLKADDYRAIHINNILKLKFGDALFFDQRNFHCLSGNLPKFDIKMMSLLISFLMQSLQHQLHRLFGRCTLTSYLYL